MNYPTPNLSVVVLAYRSGKNITDFVDSLTSLLDREEPEWELILVANHFADDGDQTPAIAKQLADSHIRIKAVTRIKKGMMGWDMRSGLEKASGRVIVVIDGDTQFEPDLVFWVYDKLRTDNLDLCKTYRVDREDGIYRKLISNIFNY